MSLSSRLSHLWQRKTLRLGLIAPLLACLLLGVGARHNPPVAHASDGVFTHIATPANSAFDYTRLDENDAYITNNPNALLFVTPNATPGGKTSPFLDWHPIGVFYSAPSWYIFHQDGTPIQSGDAFNVYADLSAYDYHGMQGALVQTATSANSSANYTMLDNPDLNGQPNMLLWVTLNWNPGNVTDDHPIGVFYSAFTGHWYILNQDKTPIPAGATFNVQFFIPDGLAGGVQTATNTTGWAVVTYINDAGLNGDPGAILFVMPVWNPGGWPSGVYENHFTGVYYNGTAWGVIDEDFAPIPNGAAFFYMY